MLTSSHYVTSITAFRVFHFFTAFLQRARDLQQDHGSSTADILMMVAAVWRVA